MVFEIVYQGKQLVDNFFFDFFNDFFFFGGYCVYFINEDYVWGVFFGFFEYFFQFFFVFVVEFVYYFWVVDGYEVGVCFVGDGFCQESFICFWWFVEENFFWWFNFKFFEEFWVFEWEFDYFMDFLNGVVEVVYVFVGDFRDVFFFDFDGLWEYFDFGVVGYLDDVFWNCVYYNEFQFIEVDWYSFEEFFEQFIKG